MDRDNAPPPTRRAMPRHLLTVLYPALAALPPQDWDAALRKARSAEFDTLEWLGVIGAVGLVAWLLQFDLPPSGGRAPLALFLLQFPLALLLLAVVAGPFYLRRTRRGLEQEIRKRHRRRGPG